MSRDIPGRPVDPAQIVQRLQADTPLIDSNRLDDLFVYLLRFPALYREAATTVRYDLFQPHEVGHGFLWYILHSAMQQFGAITAHELIREAEHTVRTSASPPPLDSLLPVFGPGGLVQTAFSIPPDQLLIERGRANLQAFLHERTIVFPLRQLGAQHQGYPSDLSAPLKAFSNAAERLKTTTSVPIVAVSPPRGTDLARTRIASLTGWEPVDRYFGGQCTGDLNVILAPTGCGKTTAAVTLAVARSKTIATMIDDTPDHGLVVFACYEQDAKEELRPMVWSNAAAVRRSKLERMKDWESLSTRETLEDYEKALNAGLPEPLCERDRYDRARAWLDPTLVLLDMSGSEENPAAGSGGPAELRGYLERIRETRRRNIDTIIVDWVGLLCTRAGMGREAEGASMHSAIRDTMADLRDIMKTFNCTMWATHQIKGARAGSAPHLLLHHSDAQDCSTLGNLASLIGCIGTEHKPTGCRFLNWSKARTHNSDIKLTPNTVRINPLFCRLDDVSQQFTLDPVSRQFVQANEMHTMRTAGAIGGGGAPSSFSRF